MSHTLLDSFPCGCVLWEELDMYGEVKPDWRPCKKHVTQLEEDNERLRKFIQEKARYIPKAGGGLTELEWLDG